MNQDTGLLINSIKIIKYFKNWVTFRWSHKPEEFQDSPKQYSDTEKPAAAISQQQLLGGGQSAGDGGPRRSSEYLGCIRLQLPYR